MNMVNLFIHLVIIFNFSQMCLSFWLWFNLLNTYSRPGKVQRLQLIPRYYPKSCIVLTMFSGATATERGCHLPRVSGLLNIGTGIQERSACSRDHALSQGNIFGNYRYLFKDILSNFCMPISHLLFLPT